MEHMSNKIRELRFRNGEMTQKTLAEQVGISRQTMNAIENGRNAPTVSIAIRIADVFCITVDELFSLNYDGKPAPLQRPIRAASDRSRVSIEEPVRTAFDQPQAPPKEPVHFDSRPEPVSENGDRPTTMADLRKVIGP